MGRKRLTYERSAPCTGYFAHPCPYEGQTHNCAFFSALRDLVRDAGLFGLDKPK